VALVSHKTKSSTTTNFFNTTAQSHQENMKCSNILSALCIMAASLQSNNGMASAQQPPSMIGLAIATEHPDLHPANACAKQDAMILDEIAAALMSAYSETHDADYLGEQQGNRNLYTMSTTCKYRCRGFLPGKCWYAFPWCWPFRRRSLRALQQETEAHQQPLTELLADELEVDHSIDCAKSIVAAEAKMAALAETMGVGACRDALLEKKIYECVHLKFTM
jgi:hypothetical protein